MHGYRAEINVAATCVGTAALGPGWRSVVWVQGCPFSCPGCIAPEWIPRRTARLVDAEALAGDLLADVDVTGLTLSGGEPMLQARAVAAFVRAARRRRELSVICFTGYTLERLQRRINSGVGELLAEVDVLIDGQYVAEADDGRGLRGSTNQRVHHLTTLLSDCGYDFEHRARTAEIRVSERELLLVGVPPVGLASGFDQALRRLDVSRPEAK